MQFIGHNIKEKRLELKWTQEYVSKKMGISQATLSRIENGLHEDLSENEIKKFADLLETNTDDLKKVPLNVNYNNNDIRGNGYVHHQTNNGTDQIQQVLSHLHESFQQVTLMMQEIKSDKEYLREENRQLRQRDEKWMQMLSDMQNQLVAFLSKK